MAFGSLIPGFTPMQMQPLRSTGLGAMIPQLLQAAMRNQGGTAPNLNAPVNPGTPAPAGSPNYVPGGEGPAFGGPAMLPNSSGMGLLGNLMARFRNPLGGGPGPTPTALTGLW